MTISGTGFVAGTSVKLLCPNEPDVLATGVSPSSGGRILTASFDLTTVAASVCTLVMSNPDGTSAVADTKFTIVQGGAPQIWVDVVGLDKIRIGRSQTYYVMYGNTGNTDGLGVPVTISVPIGAIVTLGFSLTPPPASSAAALVNWSQFSPVVQTPTSQLIPLFIPVIPVGQSAVLPITLTFPSNFPAHFFATISVSANAPYFSSLSNPVQAFSQTSNCVQNLVATAMNAAGIFLPASCALQTALTFQNIYFAFVQNSIPPVNGPNIVGSAIQLLGSVVLTLANCAGTAVGWNQLFQAVSTAYSAVQAFKSCLPIATQLLNAFIFISQDPNEKIGSLGTASNHYVSGAVPFRYAVFFSNLESATAPAEDITVTDQLDLSHDELASLSLGPISFGDVLISPPAGASTFSRTVDLRPGNNLLVKVEASLDRSIGLLAWRFTSLDPTTNQPPLDPTAGFLPPGGAGSVFFTVMPKSGIPTNTQINNQATIVFDANAPIPTRAWFNTIDNDKPQSHVLTLRAQSAANIPLQWVGIDAGAGVQDFTIFVSDNGGPFTPFLTNVPSTSATFPGQAGHTYAFFSTARDLVGNVEDLKTTPEATATVLADTILPTTVAVVAPPPNVNGWNNSDVSISLSSTDNPGGSGVQQVTFSATGAQAIASTNIAGSLASVLISTEGITNFSFFATDLAGNVEAAHPLIVQLDKTPPSITDSRTPLANANGWNNTDVTVSFACSDVLSGLAPGSPPGTALVSSEGVNQQVPGVCLDLAGNAASVTASGINIDKTPPSIAPSHTPTANANGWDNTNVTVSFACADALSGLAPGNPPAATVLAGEGTNQQVSGTCFDLAGNSASGSTSGINIDKTPPKLSGLPATNCTLWPPNHKFVTVATIAAADVLSGLASFSVTGTSNEPQNPNDSDIIITGMGLGPRTVQLRADRLGTGTGRVYTITSTATDTAGNVVNATSTCVVPHDQAR